jgi:hypothetical protein
MSATLIISSSLAATAGKKAAYPLRTSDEITVPAVKFWSEFLRLLRF